MSDAIQPSPMCRCCSAAMAPGSLYCSACGVAVIGPDDEPASVLDAAAKFAKGTALEAGHHLKEAMKSNAGQKIAGGAALGAVAGLALPFVTIGVGAVIGAGIVAYRRLLK